MSSENQTVRTIGKLLQLNGKKFVTDLQWGSLTSPTTAKREMLEQAKSQKLNLGLVYSGMALQSGMARVPASEVRSFVGAWSLAGVLASKLGQSWFGVFNLDDGNFALVAVYDGWIVPGCDLVGDFETVRHVVNDMATTSSSASSPSNYSWERLYISDSRLSRYFDSSIPVSEQGLDDILGKDKKWDSSLRLKSLAGGVEPKTLLIGTALILAAGGFGGYKYYEHKQFQAELDAAMAGEQAAAGNRRAQEIARAKALVQERAIRPSWPQQPRVGDVLQACRNALGRTPLNVAGWEITEVACGTNTMQARYKRQIGATMESFHAAGEKLRSTSQIDGFNVLAEAGTLRILYTDLKPRGDEDIEKFSNFSMRWLSHFQSLDISVSLMPKPHPAPPPPERSLVNLLGQENAVAPPPWWDTYTWKFSTQSINGLEILTPLAQMAGLVIQKITVVPQGATMEWNWTLEGEIHVTQ